MAALLQDVSPVDFAENIVSSGHVDAYLLALTNEYHADNATVCTPKYNALGVNFANGQPKAGQTMFSVQ
jgi:hypothetical protein